MVSKARDDWLNWVWLVAIAVVVSLPALLIYPFPSQDGHQHGFTAFALSRLDDPALGLGRYLQANLPLSSQGYVLSVTALDVLLPFAWAERLGLALLLAAFPVCGALYAVRTGREPLPVAGLLALTAHGWVLIMGFYNFMMAFAAVPLVLMLFFRVSNRAGGPSSWIYSALALVLLALAWLHLAVAVFAGVCLLAITLSSPDPSRWRRLLALILAGLPSAVYVWWAGHRYVETAVGGGVITAVTPRYEPCGRRLVDLFCLGWGGISWIAGVAAISLAGWVGLKALSAGDGDRRYRAVLVALAAGLAVGFLAAPIQASRWAYLSPRILYAALVTVSLVSVRAALTQRAKIVVLGLVLIGLAGSGAKLADLHWELAPLRAGVFQAPHRARMPMIALELQEARGESWPRYFEPTLHLATRSLMLQGGVSPYLFALNRSVHSVSYRDDPARMVGGYPAVYVRRGLRCDGIQGAECQAHRLGLTDRIAYYGLFWTELLLFHPPEYLAQRLVQRGYRLVYYNGAAGLWIAQPAWLTVHLELPEGPLPADLVVVLGWLGSVGWVYGSTLPAGSLPAPRETLSFGPLLAGPFDLEMFLDFDRDGEADPSEWSQVASRVSLRPGEAAERGWVIDSW